MEKVAGSRTPRPVRGIHLPLPESRKGWGGLVLATLALILLLVGLAQIFRIGLTPSSSAPAGATRLQWRDMIGILSRTGVLPMDDGEEIGLDVLLATPQYFAVRQGQAPASALAEPSLLFYVTENTHIDDLPSTPPEPLLRIDPAVHTPAETVVMADSYHHRTTLLRYSAEDFDSSSLSEGSVLELVFPTPEGMQSSAKVLHWVLPLQYSDDYSSSEVVVGLGSAGPFVPAASGVAVLAVLGGLLAAMWPCLFQLTAYFIPAMAGMSMQQASSTTGLRPRVGVVRIAFFFVLGFTIVYTLAGAVIGYGSQRLSDMESFYIWQRYLSIGAGVILLGLALRVASKARAPLVCKMPILSRSARKGVASPWESMLVGVAFATGCMTCFGSAVLIGMVLYVGLSGSPLVGAMLLFVFSLGMGVPLVTGAMLMARVLPLLFRIEKAIPWMGLASATVIAGYGIVLITGNFMTITAWFYGLMGVASPLS